MAYNNEVLKAGFQRQVIVRSDKLMNYFLLSFFITGLCLAGFYDTWLIAIVVGSINILAYYSTRLLLPQSDLYQYVLSAVLAVFMAQYIYQMHGLFEMHFFAFIASAVLITYQNWKLQIPLVIVVIIHHALLSFLQNAGYDQVYFTQLDVISLQTFIIHILLAIAIFFTCGLWAHQLNKYSEIQVSQTIENTRLLEEAHQLQEKKLAQEKLEEAYKTAIKAREEAERANQAKSVFLATMSHEIRTPMNGVLGMASLLQETELNEQQRMYTDSIASCGESLLNVINDILDYSKIESGALDIESVEFDLRTCIEDVLEMFGSKASEAAIELIYHIGDNVPLHIIGDQLRLRQILTNLVGNAIKFTPSGEIFVGVKQMDQSSRENVMLEFCVRDTGIGIPLDKQEKLFKSFSQVDSSTTRKYGGTGLGLAISENLAKLMGGEIWVKSEAGNGSAFYFTIECKKGLNNFIASYNGCMSEKTGSRILIVDDNHTNRTILQNQLTLWKLVPVAAASGSEALRILEEDQQFDLVLTDLQMPEMDGLAFTEYSTKNYPQIPVVLLSSAGDDLTMESRSMFKAILNKPVKQKLLGNTILTALGAGNQTSNPKTNTKKLKSDFATKHPMSIMIAEDNVFNQQLLIQILQKLGYHADLAENGVEALQRVNSKDYDLIFMDMQMPEMSGPETTRIIRKRDGRQPVIIALTANTLQGDKDECLKSGMDDYLSKPLKLEDLVTKLEQWYRPSLQ
jgi:signal transduction histidine kinase/CheY-like chemotaxis protein